MIQTSVLKPLADRRIHVYVVWGPITANDSEQYVPYSQGLLSDPRAEHFWDGGLVLGKAYAPVLKLPPGEIAWDIYLLFAPGLTWTDPVPTPSFWMHQLPGAPPDLVLDPARLLREIEAVPASR